MRAFCQIVNFFANIVDDSSVTNTACSYQQLVAKPTEKVGGPSAPLVELVTVQGSLLINSRK